MFKKLFEHLSGTHESGHTAKEMVYSNKPTTMNSISDLYDFMYDQEPLNPSELSNSGNAWSFAILLFLFSVSAKSKRDN